MKTITAKTIKRSRTAELLDRTPRTIARWEAQGILTPIKLNCRSVVYALAQVEAILRGEVLTSPREPQTIPTPRTKSGTFGPRALPSHSANC